MSDEGFVKIYGDRLLGSSLMDEALEARWMFICLASKANADGFVRCQTTGTAARLANLTEEQAQRALDVLSSPDPRSTSPEHEGRRILRVEGGWFVVNHRKYRDLRTETQVRKAARQKRWRESHKASTRDARDARETQVSASASASVSVPEGVQGEDVRGEQMLRASRVAKEREFYALVAKIAAAEDMDGPEVARTMSGYEREGVKVAGKMRPETLSDERLEKSLADGRAWLEALNGKPARR